MNRKTIILLVILFVLVGFFPFNQPLMNYFREGTTPLLEANVPEQDGKHLKLVSDKIKKGETLSSIFAKYGIRPNEFLEIKTALANIHSLRDLRAGKPYSFTLNDENYINSFTYEISDDTILKIEKVDGYFQAHKYNIPYESRILTIGGTIQKTLISAFGSEREDYLLALQVADILAWDIDFNIDIRIGDSFKIIVEGLYSDGKFKKYGQILSIEFINNNHTYSAYLFERDGKKDYYNAEGQSLRRAFLKAPLNFRRISSRFSKNRLHPIRKIRCPHNGVDYAAATGTPVNVTADGTVNFAGYRGGFGKLIIISHPNGYRTYYGHLSRISKNIRQGKKVQQGDLIGYVGSTGLSTGPHLHYEMRLRNHPINPLKVKKIAGKPVPSTQMAEFKKLTRTMDNILHVALFYDTKNTQRKNHSLQPALLYASLASNVTEIF
ncbi:MAG: peptidoglycan DD-metalloendopeptidase family protein [Syntrophaceae bacterium]|nr:peptidoglycan DD-metalloendopeptidase family protein [Syntrophaceae bacterium]